MRLFIHQFYYSMSGLRLCTLLVITVLATSLEAQNVPILNYSTNNIGQVQLEIESKADEYYLLSVFHEPDLTYETTSSITMGVDGTMTISEPLAAYSVENYRITAHSKNDPIDSDEDGIDDITEYEGMPALAPLNFAEEVPFRDGSTSINSAEIFTELAVVNEDIPWAPFLNDREFMKFAIVNQSSDRPEIFFINSKTHYIHAEFLFTIGVDQAADDVVSGEIVFNPNEINSNGVLGTYSFNYSFGESYSFEHTRQTFELLAANMPFLRNNLNHFIGQIGEVDYQNQFKDGFVGSRIPVVLESEFFADVDYLPFNQAEGYGFFKKMELDENPGSRDIVLYDALPNSLPRVGGIITSVIQTPLSHVNLRAIQDNVPNAYIKNPLEIDSISNLIGKYVNYKVSQDKYEIREATLEEVNDWYEKLRPTVEQIPERNLSQTKILPLDEIEFSMSDVFGAKCTNVATMRKFGFPEGTIPDGFGVPFYFYDEFMKYNGFYEKAQQIITDPEFIADLETRIDKLKDFRKEIKDADMPAWMLDELQAMHDAFPVGTAVRCRSSTNNEDLPGFSGAGLYTSKTQHLDEGHISKSIKQVYASMWNFRAYDERDFYRVDHSIAAMGVLCHPNFQEEKSNGVGVSIDPIYQTEGNFYLNTQVGESLITNPDANSIPEELLLGIDPDDGFIVLRNSNLVPNGTLVMEEEYLNQMRDYLTVIHDEFEILYDLEGAEGFGMDIEYKVTREDQLIIKQARPWVSFWADIKANFDLAVTEIIEPLSSSTLGNSELIKATVSNQGLEEMGDFTIHLFLNDQLQETMEIAEPIKQRQKRDFQFTIPLDLSIIDDYKVSVLVEHPLDGYERNDTLTKTISKLYELEAELVSATGPFVCDAFDINATIANKGATTINDLEFDVMVNGVPLERVLYDNPIPRQSTKQISFEVSANLTQEENEIELILAQVNGQIDEVTTNNSTTFISNADLDYKNATLLINPDDYYEENSWIVSELVTGEVIGSGDFLESDFEVDLCLNENSCYMLTIVDSFGDGICCDFGDGNVYIYNNEGEEVLYDNGRFEFLLEKEFCLDNPTSSTSLVEQEKKISLYPNPTTGAVTIVLAESELAGHDMEVEIFNNLGVLIRTQKLSAYSDEMSFEVSLENFTSGNYIIKCSSSKFEEYLRIVKL